MDEKKLIHDNDAFITRIGSLVQDKRDKAITSAQLLDQLQQLEEEHSAIDMVRKIREKLADAEDRLIYYAVCHWVAKNSENNVNSSLISNLFDGPVTRKRHQVLFSNRTHNTTLQRLVDQYGGSLHLLDEGAKICFGEKVIRGLRHKVNRYEFFSNVAGEWSDGYFFHNVDKTEVIYEKIEELEDKNTCLPFIPKLRDICPKIELRAMIYFIADLTVENRHFTFHPYVNEVLGTGTAYSNYIKFKNKTHELQSHNLVNICNPGSFDTAYLVLTSYACDLLFDDDAWVYDKSIPGTELVKCADIIEKRIFLNPDAESQLALLRSCCTQPGYDSLRERLAQQGLPCGISALLYGEPGTGKTETVMQIARASGRDVMLVDISEIRHSWLGDTEKVVKSLFSWYKNILRQNPRAPILLFNEADALLSRRRDPAASSLILTENAMLNIILEQMESFEGIVFATTNMVERIDPAFERRFLFKVKYERPGRETRAKIWADKMPQLPAGDIDLLSASYDLTGSEIENVVRKSILADLLQGSAPALPALIAYCNEERLPR